ncbi:MAG: peptidoglycan-binding protein [Sarcina sp.]
MDKQGTLKCQCFNGNSVEPIEKAKITVTNANKTINKIIYTNSSGIADEIILETPSIDASQKPGETPYSLYDLLIERDGFQPLVIKGVQIYPDRVGIQQCNITKSTSRDETRADIIEILPNRLVGGDFPNKIPEADTKELPKATGKVVLPSVVVPQYIVVHAGLPDDATAPDYTVAYSDYIKNVASSEIFSTWPENTIKANIYCIVSFTLNRIYTEWYRGKGKSFDITNNTAYDQAFVYGRTIYNSISTIVDDLFASYIKRNNEKQPLLTQYCNGTTSTCPGWLTQWGSKYLGDQGDTPYEILTHFYGYDLNINTAPKVQGIPTSYPGYTLQLGSSGIYVRRLQTYLNSISNNYPLINKVAVDGNYGATTQKAVKTYQQTFNLPVTGSVNYATWYSISNTYVAVNKLAELRGNEPDNETGGIFIPPSMYDFTHDIPKIRY